MCTYTSGIVLIWCTFGVCICGRENGAQTECAFGLQSSFGTGSTDDRGDTVGEEIQRMNQPKRGTMSKRLSIFGVVIVYDIVCS